MSDENESTVQMHKHCQATVCSAYGYNGQGMTWSVLENAVNELQNLPNGWLGRFMENGENIT